MVVSYIASFFMRLLGHGTQHFFQRSTSFYFKGILLCLGVAEREDVAQSRAGSEFMMPYRHLGFMLRHEPQVASHINTHRLFIVNGGVWYIHICNKHQEVGILDAKWYPCGILGVQTGTKYIKPHRIHKITKYPLEFWVQNTSKASY